MRIASSIKLALIALMLSLSSSVLYADIPTDEDIEDAIESEIALDDIINSDMDISIEAFKGKVTIQGTVDSINEANRLTYIAKSASGVTDVDTRGLTIRRPSSD